MQDLKSIDLDGLQQYSFVESHGHNGTPWKDYIFVSSKQLTIVNVLDKQIRESGNHLLKKF
jgi:hypothetical protein